MQREDEQRDEKKQLEPDGFVWLFDDWHDN